MYLLSFIFIIVVTSAIIIILFVITNAEQYVTLVIVKRIVLSKTRFTIDKLLEIFATLKRRTYEIYIHRAAFFMGLYGPSI